MKKTITAPEAYKINKKIRRKWSINPVTKVKQDERRIAKKRRQNDKMSIKRFNLDEFK